MGSKNNLVTVKMSDFEVFQALAKDSEGIHSSAQTEYSQVNVIKFLFLYQIIYKYAPIYYCPYVSGYTTI